MRTVLFIKHDIRQAERIVESRRSLEFYGGTK